ncbi:MAG TPA: NUDIX hydrolase [Bacillota bacterium]|nr:NUDIX hydrolase [Bacillota bacterium]
MEKLVSKRVVYEGRVLSVRVDSVVTEKGRETTREIVVRPDTVAIVAIDQDLNILLVRQYRYAISKYALEIPAGLVDKGETAEEAARRELREETGYDCTNLRPIYTFWPAIGYSTEQMTIFLGTDLVFNPLKGDEEDIQVVRLPFSDVRHQVLRETESEEILFEDAKSVIGVALAAKYIDKYLNK